jgi:hypothetical protein
MDARDKLANEESASTKRSDRQPIRVRLPGFLIDEDVGLGDVIKQVTFRMGVSPCSGCEHRAKTLNSWVVFSRSR